MLAAREAGKSPQGHERPRPACGGVWHGAFLLCRYVLAIMASLRLIFILCLALNRALRRMAGLVFLLVCWALAGACQRHGVSVFLSCNSSSFFFFYSLLSKKDKGLA